MNLRSFALALCLAAAAGAAPSPTPSPAASPVAPVGDAELEAILSKLADDPAEGFDRLEDYVQLDDGQARPVAARHARAVLARFEALVKTLPAPLEKHAGELAQLLFTAGRALEEGGAAPEALPVYERIVAEYPKAVWAGGVSGEPIAQQASARLKWHQEKHPWIHKSSAELVAALRQAFAGPPAALSPLVARLGFWSGPFTSEGGADDPERVLKLVAASWPAAGPTVAPEVEAFSEAERQVFLKVSGFTSDFPDIYCILERVPEGWQWSGVSFTGKPGAEPVVAEPEAAPLGAPASPSGSPAERPSR